ncbi:hypothetical protein [Brevibacterium moorei]|nr:hypothetical protein [Brevibacterium sp. 68QC2CO]MCQ9384380.1 hypothetical protein [Brevibacterium sp. 68QC2CO]
MDRIAEWNEECAYEEALDALDERADFDAWADEYADAEREWRQ